MKSKQPLTVIIPVKNEEDNIREVLETVTFADEIMIVDSFSTDQTLTIAKEYTNFIIQRDYEYSASQKNWAIPQASNEWILLLDADERVTPELKSEIIEVLENPPQNNIVAYWINRANHFMGKRIRYGGWKNDKVIRLFKKSNCQYEDKFVHAEIVADGEVSYLKNKLYHNTYNSLDLHINKLNKYASWKAIEINKNTRRLSLYHFILKPFWGFFSHYVLKGGFRDGFEGFVIAYLRSYSIMIRYIKMWQYRKGVK